MNTKVVFLTLIILATLLETGADVLFKQWATQHKTLLLIVGVLLYTAGTVAWAFSLREEYLSKAIGVFVILNLLIVVAVGVLFFDEKLTLLNKVGIALAVVSISLIEFF